MAPRTSKSTSPPANASPVRVASPNHLTCQPIVVSHVQAHGNAILSAAPILDGFVFYDLATAALMVGRSVNAVRLILSRYASSYDQPHYTKRGKREFRLVTARDIATLRQRWPVYVKQKQRMSP